MTERIVDFLDALVATVGAIDERYCLVEKREMPYNGETTNIPYKYVGNGNYRPVEVDGGSVSYWRLVNNISFDVVDGNSAIKNLQATYPIRYVAMVKRDANNPLVFSQDVANVLEGRNKDLQTQLQAKNVNITVGSIDTDTPKIWSEEFTMPLKEPDYKRSLIMIDITVTVIAKRECWESCDNFPDILQGFDWCDAATYQRLTQEQQDCLQAFLCGSPDPVTEQINGVTIGTAASGTTNNQVIENTLGTQVGTSANPSVVPDATVQINSVTVGTIPSGDTDSFTVNLDGTPSGTWDGDSWEVTSAPCADATVNINGVFMDSIPSGGTENIEVRQETGATLVGSKQGQYWRIDDSAISINGSPVADVAAEDSLDIDVIQDGLPVGSWNGSEWVVPPCTIPSLSVAASSLTEELDGSITFTLTPTDITPTEYVFTFDGEVVTTATTASTTLNWTVDTFGSVTVYVQAKDGSGNTVADATPLTLTISLDADAQAQINVLTSPTVQDKIRFHNLVTQLKADGIWSKFYALHVQYGTIYADQKWNLKDPQDTDAAFRITVGGGLYSSRVGMTGNNVNGYGDTHFNVSTDLISTSDVSIGFYNYSQNIGNKCVMGVGNIFNLANSISIFPSFSNIFYANAFGVTVGSNANSNCSGLFVVTRGNSTEFSMHKRGSSTIDKTIVTGLSSIPNGNIWICGGNATSGSVGYSYSPAIIGYSFIGKHLTTTDIDNLFSAFETFKSCG